MRELSCVSLWPGCPALQVIPTVLPSGSGGDGSSSDTSPGVAKLVAHFRHCVDATAAKAAFLAPLTRRMPGGGGGDRAAGGHADGGSSQQPQQQLEGHALAPAGDDGERANEEGGTLQAPSASAQALEAAGAERGSGGDGGDVAMAEAAQQGADSPAVQSTSAAPAAQGGASSSAAATATPEEEAVLAVLDARISLQVFARGGRGE